MNGILATLGSALLLNEIKAWQHLVNNYIPFLHGRHSFGVYFGVKTSRNHFFSFQQNLMLSVWQLFEITIHKILDGSSTAGSILLHQF